MLFKILHFLEEQLNQYFDALSPNEKLVTSPVVVLANIATLDESALKSKNNIFITLVNLTEEATLKNIPNYIKDGNNTIYKNPPVYLNLFVLFSACMTNYDHSLVYLSHVLKYFQGKNLFTGKNSYTQIGGLEQFKIIMDLYSPSFEQVNYLWSTLGGKQHPFVLYKIRLAEIERDNTNETRTIINELDIYGNIKVNN